MVLESVMDKPSNGIQYNFDYPCIWGGATEVLNITVCFLQRVKLVISKIELLIRVSLIDTSALRLLGRFTTFLAQTTTASWLLFASRMRKIGNLRFFNFFKNFVAS